MSSTQVRHSHATLLHVVAPPSLTTWFEHFVTAGPDRVLYAPEDDDADALVGRIGALSPGRVVMHSSHRSLRRDAQVAAQLRERGVTVVAQPPSVVDVALDKGGMKELFKAAGVPTPPSPDTAPSGTRDWVVKLRLSTEGDGMRHVVGPAPKCADGEYCEAFVPGIEFSVVGYFDDSRCVVLPVVEKGWANITLRPPYRRTRTCPPDARFDVAVETMVELTRRLAAHGKMQGWLEVEFVVDPSGQVWALEINPRICGTMRLAAMCADIRIFDVPGMDDLDGVLPSTGVGIEVPWSGKPIVDPASKVFATSRLTIVAAASDELAHRLDELGVDPGQDVRRTETEAHAAELRRVTMTLIAHAEGGHPGSSLSAADVLSVLYLHLLRTERDERDRFFLSKGHAAPALYAALILAGVIDRSELTTLRRLGSPLQGHPDPRFTPGVDAPSGSLAQGLSIAVGTALGLRRAASLARVTALVGDGECQEGQVWEAAAFAAQQRLNNLCVVIDANGLQHDAPTAAISGATDLAAAWAAFGWSVCEVDGHDVDALEAALRGAPTIAPRAVVAHTVKGRGVPFMEDVVAWHSVHDASLLAEALASVGGDAR